MKPTKVHEVALIVFIIIRFTPAYKEESTKITVTNTIGYFIQVIYLEEILIMEVFVVIEILKLSSVSWLISQKLIVRQALVPKKVIKEAF